MCIRDSTQDEEEFSNPEVYTEEEMEAVEGHIEEYFGEFENVFHEIVSPDIHVDICVVPPTEERDYYTLVTMGTVSYTHLDVYKRQPEIMRKRSSRGRGRS